MQLRLMNDIYLELTATINILIMTLFIVSCRISVLLPCSTLIKINFVFVIKLTSFVKCLELRGTPVGTLV